MCLDFLGNIYCFQCFGFRYRLVLTRISGCDRVGRYIFRNLDRCGKSVVAKIEQGLDIVCIRKVPVFEDKISLDALLDTLLRMVGNQPIWAT